MLSQWRIGDFAHGEGVAQGAFAEAFDDAAWAPATAPGDVHRALQDAGRIIDPHADGGEAACRWIEDREWWWRTTFEAAAAQPGETLRLRFEGLDTFATVWLNGQEIGVSDNMFVPLELDVTSLLRDGANTLAVCFTPPAEVVRDKPSLVWGKRPTIDTKRNLIRKAQYAWGWDWGPRVSGVGIWRPVDLLRIGKARLAGVHFETLGLDDAAHLRITVEAERLGDAELSAHIVLKAPGGDTVIDRTLDLTDTAELTFDLADPQLWWSKGLGDQPLYGLSVDLLADGEVIDSDKRRVGIRTIALDTAPDPDEADTRFFRFLINGVSIFAKGACWIPAHNLLGGLGEADYRPILTQAADAHMNMIRVWGGGIYEHDVFYDLCDELGLLVWQDFMFACALYPQDDPAFIASVEAEADAQIRRLRTHTSLALWCGNNENQFIQDFTNNGSGRKDLLEGRLYYDELLPAAVERLDASRLYWPGSPFGGPHANSMLEGDVHNWTVWHGLPPVPRDWPTARVDLSPEGVRYQRFAEDMSRFVSEFGIQASPALETLRRCLPKDQQHYGSEALAERIKDTPKNKVDAMMGPVTGIPETLQQYVDFTQITQAESLKFGIEHYRRRTPHCSGALIWQLNDCWPGISWSLVDHNGFEKAGYHFVRRAFAPLLASFKVLDDGAVELWLTNDAVETFAGQAVVSLVDMTGGQVWSETIDVRADALSSAPVWTAPADRIAPAPNMALLVRSPSDAFPANRQFFAPIKSLERPVGAAPEVLIEQLESGKLAVRLRAPAFLFFVHVLAPSGTARFSDNHFDMAAGEERTIIVHDPSGALTAADIQVRSV